MEIRAKTGRPKTVTKDVTVTPTVCVVCGKKFNAERPALTCSLNCRVALNRLRKRGERPPYSKKRRKGAGR